MRTADYKMWAVFHSDGSILEFTVAETRHGAIEAATDWSGLSWLKMSKSRQYAYTVEKITIHRDGGGSL
jgi:hypothetical protein